MIKEKVIKAYKAFDKGMQCQGFQYEVGKEYDMGRDVECCKRGYHACESPLEVFDHYDMLTSRFAEVEQSGQIDSENGSTKVCSSRIKIKAEQKLTDIINIGVEWLKDITSPSKIKVTGGLSDNGDDYKNINSSGDYVQIGSNGAYTQISSTGTYVKIGTSGEFVLIGSSGSCTQIGSSGDYAEICSGGDRAKIGSNGDNAKIGSNGHYTEISSNGGSVLINSNGGDAKIGSNGGFAKICSSGNDALIYSSGNYAQIVSNGDYAKIDSTGEDCVIMCSGEDSIVKAKVGSWITLAEWVWSNEKNRRVPKCVKTEYVDGERIKADTWYKIVNGEFEEVTE